MTPQQALDHLIKRGLVLKPLVWHVRMALKAMGRG